MAEDFRKNRDFKKALQFYVKALNSFKTPFREKHLSFKGLDRIYKIQKNNKKKYINSQRWLTWLQQENMEQSLKKYYKHYLEMAREEWNRDENTTALKLITDLLQDEKSKSVQEDALYLRGMIYVQQGEFENSLKDWDEAVKKINKTKNKPYLLEKILWKKAWLLRDQKRYREAFNQLKFLENITKNPYTLYRTMFWKGKTLHDLGQRTRAKRGF